MGPKKNYLGKLFFRGVNKFVIGDPKKRGGGNVTDEGRTHGQKFLCLILDKCDILGTVLRPFLLDRRIGKKLVLFLAQMS